jgi:hypothetical protein
MNNTVYEYSWGNNPKRRMLLGRKCLLIACGALNSAKVRFLDSGETEIIDRRALRKSKVTFREIEEGRKEAAELAQETF